MNSAGFVDMAAVEQDAVNVWASSAEIRAEFGNRDAYLAYRKADARGAVRMLTTGGARNAQSSGTADWMRQGFASENDYQAYCRAMGAGASAVARRNVPGSVADDQRPSARHANASLVERQASVRRENVGRVFAGLPALPVPQE